MLKPMSEWTDKELRDAVKAAPHLKWEDSANMAVHLGVMAKKILEKRTADKAKRV